MSRFSQHVAIVTGGGTGIGQATAIALAGEGASVVVVGRSADTLAETEILLYRCTRSEVRHLTVQADVRDPVQVDDVIGRTLHAFGRIDLLVNSAGVNVPERHMRTVSLEAWDQIIGTNLTGTFLMSRAVLPAMREQGSGTIVNVSSIAGFRPSLLTGPAYNAAKAGVNAFTESLNQTERVHGIRSCVICPGEVATPILEQRPVPPSDQARALMLQPHDVADTVLFVASLPPRATVELLTLYPTAERDWAAELE